VIRGGEVRRKGELRCDRSPPGAPAVRNLLARPSAWPAEVPFTSERQANFHRNENRPADLRSIIEWVTIEIKCSCV